MTKTEAVRTLEFQTGFRYPLRWADGTTSLGDYDGRDLTIEVFDIPTRRQREFYRAIRQLRDTMLRVHGRAVTFIFHTPEATRQFYGYLFPSTCGATFDGPIHISLVPGSAGTRVVVENPLHFPLRQAA